MNDYRSWGVFLQSLYKGTEVLDENYFRVRGVVKKSNVKTSGKADRLLTFYSAT